MNGPSLERPRHALRVRLQEEDEGLSRLPPHDLLLRDDHAVPGRGVRAVGVHLEQVAHVDLFKMNITIWSNISHGFMRFIQELGSI